MPETKNALTRYRIIDNYLSGSSNKAPSLFELAELCSEILGKEVSESTIEKDLRVMRDEPPKGYGAPIVYDKFQRGYIYKEEGFSIKGLRLEYEEWEGLAYASNLLHQYRDVPIFRSFKDAIDKIHAHFNIPLSHDDDHFNAFVQFETGNSSSGYHWLGCCYRAIRNCQTLRIQYENIYRKEIKHYEIQPYLLKEHRNRWYVIGWAGNRNDYLTFALDRIKEVSILPGKQKLRKDFDPNNFLRYAIGIMEGDSSAETVELELFAPADKLIMLDPLHPSQQIQKEGKNSITVSLEVNLNPELYQRILSFGSSCKIKKPAKLKQAIKTELEQALRYYH